MTYTAKKIEELFRNAASLRISQKRSGDERYKGDAGYWDGGRCEYGGAHNLQEDCQNLGKFFESITELKNARQKLTKFDNQNEFDKNKQDLLNKTNQSLSGLQMRTGANTSIGGICIIWDNFASYLNMIVDDFRREVENLKRDIERVSYNEAKELQKLNQEERKLQKEIEENEKKARNEPDPEKKKKFMILANQAKEKWKKVLERKKQLKSSSLGDNFDPNKHINDFIQAIEDKLKNRPPKRDPNNPNFPPNPNHQEPGSYPSKPLDPFQSTSRTTPSNFFQSNLKLIILGTFALLVLFYLYSNQSKPETYYDF